MNQEKTPMLQKIARFSPPGLSKIIPVLAAVMEGLWVYGWLAWISGWPTSKWENAPLSIWSALILVVFTQILTRFALDRQWSITAVRLTVVPGSLLLLALLIRWNAPPQLSAVIVGAMFGTYFIWRGIANGRQTLVFADIYFKFVLGLVGTVFLLIFWGISGQQNSIWPVGGPYIISFFAVGLLALAMANLEALRSELSKFQEATSAFTRRWVSMLAALVVGIIGLALALASLFSSNIAASIIHAISVLGDWLLIALSYILLPFGYILEAIIYLARLLLSWLAGTPKPTKMEIPDLSDLQKMAEGQAAVQIPSWIVLTLKWGGLAIIAGLVIFFLTRALMRYWESRPEKDIEEVSETLWSFDALKMDLRSILAWLFRWARRKKPLVDEEAQAAAPEAYSQSDSGREFSVQELYQGLLWEGREAGAWRNTSETPYEYRHKLDQQLGKGAEEIEALTEAYVSLRYGEVPPPPEKLNLLNRMWRNLRAKLSTS